jgi:hypothetical protein
VPLLGRVSATVALSGSENTDAFCHRDGGVGRGNGFRHGRANGGDKGLVVLVEFQWHREITPYILRQAFEMRKRLIFGGWRNSQNLPFLERMELEWLGAMGRNVKAGLKGGGELRLSPRYTEKDWNDAFDGRENWNAAIRIVEDRIKGRWLDPADRLMDEAHSGFAILALDCIVLESVWGFMNGKAVPKHQEKQVYHDILTGPRFNFTPDLSESFRELVRNGIMHDAETRSRWLVEKTYPRYAVARENKNGDYVVNRTKFHRALTAAFKDWVAKLRGGDTVLRKNMRLRMQEVISKHYLAKPSKAQRPGGNATCESAPHA